MTENVSRLKAKKVADQVPEECPRGFEPCPIERGMRIIGGKWTGSIMWHLQQGPVRFNDLCRQLPGASKKMIAGRLKEMEDHKLIVRNVISTRPIAVSYELTNSGRSALFCLEQLKRWTEAQGL